MGISWRCTGISYRKGGSREVGFHHEEYISLFLNLLNDQIVVTRNQRTPWNIGYDKGSHCYYATQFDT
jgi:hypothetical protein